MREGIVTGDTAKLQVAVSGEVVKDLCSDSWNFEFVLLHQQEWDSRVCSQHEIKSFIPIVGCNPVCHEFCKLPRINLCCAEELMDVCESRCGFTQLCLFEGKDGCLWFCIVEDCRLRLQLEGVNSRFVSAGRSFRKGFSLQCASQFLCFGARFLVGLGSAEVLNRQLLATAVPQETINTEVARLTKKSFLTISVALLLGSLVDITVEDRSDFTFQSENMLPALTNPMMSLSASVTDNSTLMNAPETQASSTSATSSTIIPSLGRHRLFSLQSLGYVMMSLWFAQMIGLLLFFDVPKNKRKRRKASVNQNNLANHTQEEDFDSDSQSVIADEIGHGDDGTLEKLQTMSRKPSKNGHSHHTYMESITEIRRLLVSNVACPTTIAVLCIAKTTGEVVLSSCGSIAHRYFDWSGARSGLFMGLIATMILPINLTLASERNYTERGIIKLALVVARWGLILMVNYEALFFFAISLVKGSMREESSTGRIYYYDSIFGGVQYVVSFTIIFLSVVTLESVTLALISKVQVAPRQMRKYTIDTSFVVMLISALSRLIGDTLIVAFDASSWALFNNDIVNSLCFVLIIAVTIGIYFVKKHYFFLI